MELIDLTDLTLGYRHRPPTAATLGRARRAAVGRSGVLVDVGGGTGAHAGEWVGQGGTPAQGRDGRAHGRGVGPSVADDHHTAHAQ